MTTALPSATSFTGASVTQGNFKTAITNLVAFLQGLLGTDGTVATALAALGLKTVATSGAYSDLTGTPTALPPNGTAGGDLNGTYPNPTVDGLQGQPVSSATPTASQVLTFVSGAWTPTTPASTTPSEPVSVQSANYAIQNSDQGSLLQFTKGTAQAVTIAQAGAGGSFANGWWCDIICSGAGVVTVTPTTSTVNGLTSIVFDAGKYEGMRLISTGSQYLALFHAQYIPAVVGDWGTTDGSSAIGELKLNTFGQGTKIKVITGLSGTPGGGGGTCFLWNATVSMADGTKKPGYEVRVGDEVPDGFGGVNVVEGIEHLILGPRVMLDINGEHKTTDEHCHVRPDRTMASLNPHEAYAEWDHAYPVIAKGGKREMLKNVGLPDGIVTLMRVGQQLQKEDGPVAIRSLEYCEPLDYPPDTPLFNLKVSGSGTWIVNGYVVTGWPNKDRWDYAKWEPKS